MALKSWPLCCARGHRARVLESSFVAEVKSDLMGEQTILWHASGGLTPLLDKMVGEGIEQDMHLNLFNTGGGYHDLKAIGIANRMIAFQILRN